ncbi:sarcosine oxidase [Cordyceps fumosorosea ARSEF 2679]|uniref:Sarcosine oxidase n=1 Tax=Cordyceps fumosorosea (strain ARSEF 2679) TaxID=1081104 RepID=A0A167SC33_CORFA|nr:sarcosine oxidase [Cordyceps fumosorosea ARSEF 2679]OAA59471.1 sarcosine oxidase [Cordyceps fumosorosea ARSEF 2679]
MTGYKIPSSVLIVGSGVFGLSTAWTLTQRPEYADTKITVVDDASACSGEFPPLDAASVDSSRIIRADYADPHYAALAAVAQAAWRSRGDEDLGGQGRYSESGLVLTADRPATTREGKLTGMDYTRKSWRNVARIAREAGHPPDKVRALESPQLLREHLGTPGRPGDWGYLNALSGWADAGEGMRWQYRRVKATGRVEFVDVRVVELVTEGSRVVGAQLASGSTLRADLVVVAAGAWTGALVDLRGRVEATGHVLGYVNITQEELDVLSRQPVVLNLTSGLFIIPPRDRLLKVARHSFGYLNPVTVPRALPVSPAAPRVPIVEADADLRRAFRDLVPLRGLEGRPWRETRLCWYADTRDGDWLVDFHPGWEGLFVATGDSGHGYKFLPVLGDKIVDCIEGRGGELGRKWKWKDVPEGDTVGRETDGRFEGLITEDGSRGGYPGMILQDELAKKEAAKL